MSRAVASLVSAGLALGAALHVVACGRDGPTDNALSPAPARPISERGAPPAVSAAPGSVDQERLGTLRPGPALPDVFHPDRTAGEDPTAGPRRGGTVIVRLDNLPRSLNKMLEQGTVVDNVLGAVHESLVSRDTETWELVSPLSRAFWIEDRLIARAGEVERELVGLLREEAEAYVVTPRTGDSATVAPERVPKSEVLRVERGTVFTFELRDDVRWHDGKPFGADDVLFSFSCYRNPDVACDWLRFRIDQIERCEKLGPRTVRIVYHEQYAFAFESVGALSLLPRHVYDLSDPANPDHDGDATAEEQGRYVNEHPANRAWIGLGPYRVVSFDESTIVARRTDAYFDASDAGWLAEIRWRAIASDDAIVQALASGELDFTDNLKSDYWAGEETATPFFDERYYKGYFYIGLMTYVAWNTGRPLFADVRVRRALGRAFDWEEFLASFYKGYGFRVTSTFFRGSPGYDESVAPLAFDLELAQRELAEAGWYDRDGDGRIDKDGVPFAFEFLGSAGSKTSQAMSLQLQQNLARLGIDMSIRELDFASVNQRVANHDFDSTAASWYLPVETDPRQQWHSSQAALAGSNRSGLSDAECDRLIEAIQRELDPLARAESFRALHRRLYDLQPYSFGLNVPRRFVMNKAIRNFQVFAIPPGYAVRRWYRTDI